MTTYKTINSFPGYLISDEGDVIDIRSNTWKPLKQSPTSGGGGKGGYYNVVLVFNGKQHIKTVHCLVANAFLSPKPTPKHQVNHIDGVKANNFISNLEWVTAKENARHAINNHLRPSWSGVNNPSAKLSVDDIQYIKDHKGIYDSKTLAIKFKVTTATICKYWRKVV